MTKEKLIEFYRVIELIIEINGKKNLNINKVAEDFIKCNKIKITVTK